jgi:hypothetical protein
VDDVKTLLATAGRGSAAGAGAASATTALVASAGRSVATTRLSQHVVAGTITVSRTTLEPHSVREQQADSTLRLTYTLA